MNGGGSAIRSEEEGQGLMGGAAGAMGHIRGLVGRWPDADTVLQGGMTEGLRDWDLWYMLRSMMTQWLLTSISGALCSSVYYFHSF